MKRKCGDDKEARPLTETVVCIGSNVPGCAEEVSRAILWITGLMVTSRHTKPYPTVPEGSNSGCRPYLNAVLKGTTMLSAEELLTKFKAYERLRGRKPSDKQQGKIIIDIDLVVYGDMIVSREEFNAGYFIRGYESLGEKAL